jgi:signal transduction histidine kinase
VTVSAEDARPGDRRDRLRELAREQAALRRVATLVARGPQEQELLDLVTSEVGRLFGAQTANMVRYEGEHATVMGGWSEPGVRSIPAGARVPLDSETTVVHVHRTGRPARLQGYENVDGELARRLRELGLRHAIAAPIVVDGCLWGAITTSRTVDDPFPEGAEHRLGAFTELVAQAIANAEARDALAQSRARIVEAGDRERRRLERNLHDGAQQRLVTLALTLRLAQARLQGENAEARALLDKAADEVGQALDELRELAHGLHPALLTERGLAAALDGLAARAPLPVAFETLPDARLPPPVEAAAYYVVAEALTNTIKYARATSSTVSVRRTGGRAVVEVRDDGIGGADARAGSGLRGLADRVEALSGRLHVHSEPGRGTLLRAEIPISDG